jgi:hypothetical protein
MYLLLLLLTFSAFAVETELSGNLELQTRRTHNNSEAKDDLFQDWDQENFHLAYGNLNGKIESGSSRLEANWFGRYSRSPLYDPSLGREPYFAVNIFTFPNKLVARDLFKLQHKRQTDEQQIESVLNKFYYEWSQGESKIAFGRLYVNYGQGEIFNPVNPFNQPTGLTSISQVAQGNDGASYKIFLSETHNLDLIVLGDKAQDNYEGDISKTLWAHGEIQASEKLQLDYVLGEDQKRYKAGGQLSYNFEEAMVFTQLLYQSSFVNNRPSHNLWDFMLGYDEQLTSKWHLRFEGGYQKQNRHQTLQGFGERFLPTEYFAAIANQYEIHPLVKLGATLINDIKSGFTYFIAKATWDIGYDSELELFGFSPVSQGDSTDNPAQKLVTRDYGLALRKFF